nr:hypothetical protein GCM10025699_66710 [Microbacterium flavescens]
MRMAVAGLTTESIGAAMIGVSNWNASIDQPTDTSRGSRVRRLGTIAMSSNAYARRARLDTPISTSVTVPPYRRPGSSPRAASRRHPEPTPHPPGAGRARGA